MQRTELLDSSRRGAVELEHDQRLNRSHPKSCQIGPALSTTHVWNEPTSWRPVGNGLGTLAFGICRQENDQQVSFRELAKPF